MTVTLVQIENGEPSFYATGKTVNDLKMQLDIDGEDREGFIGMIEKADLSGVNTKFEISGGIWILFA